MNAESPDPRQTDEWRVEVQLESGDHGETLSERLHSMDLDDEARKLLGGSVIVTRDGSHLFLYAWHEQSAREAEKTVRNLMEHEDLSGEVQLMRWHPGADEWKPASEPMPETAAEEDEEIEDHEERARREFEQTGHYDWEAIVELPSLKEARSFAKVLHDRDLPVRRRFHYLIVGAVTEEDARELASELDEISPEGSAVGFRANPVDVPHPLYVRLTAMKPGVVRDLGL